MTNADLNRKIAELVMGEPEPEMPPDPEGSGLVSIGFSKTLHVSAGGNWVLDYEDFHWPGHPMNKIAWQPLDFSGDFNLAMRAVDVFAESKGMKHRRVILERVSGEAKPWGAWWGDSLKMSYGAPGLIASEAICRMLLAVAQEERRRGE